MNRIAHDASALLWSALVLAASAVSAGCSSSHERSDGDGGGGGGPDGSAGAHDGGGPGPGSDAAASCPATYADITWGAPCSGPGLTCDYYGQFYCQCLSITNPTTYWQWVCQEFNCICLPADAGCATFCPNDASPSCINQACNTDADCPSGQHCGQAIGPGVGGGKVCSVGCEGDAGPPSIASCPFGGTCESIAP